MKKKDLNDLSARCARWVLDFESFKPFELKIRPGTSIPHADALSREPFASGNRNNLELVGGVSKINSSEKDSAGVLVTEMLPVSNVEVMIMILQALHKILKVKRR